MSPTSSLGSGISSSAGVNGFPVSAAMLTDPKALKKQFSNGIREKSSSSLIEPSRDVLRQTSEPPISSSLLDDLVSSQPSSQLPKDDAYSVIESKGKRALHQQPVVHPHSNHFDARRLLDPKGFNKSPRQNVGMKTDQSQIPVPEIDGQNKRAHEGIEGLGMSSLIERMHNVSQREERPQKKQKTEKSEFEDEETNRHQFRGGGKGGDIGEYMAEKRKEGAAKSGTISSTVVDLTGGDEEEVVIVSDSQEKEVCYGRLDMTKVQAHQLPHPNGKSMFLTKNDWPNMKLQLRRHPGKDNIIRVIDPTGKDFGNVDLRTSLGLAKIMDSRNPKFRTQARLNARKKHPGDFPGKECSEYFDITINLYGPKSRAPIMGKFLSQRQIWLRTPFMVDAGVEVINPHQPAVAPPRTSHSNSYGPTSVGPGTGYVARTVEEIRSDVVGMFDSLERSENLPEMEPHARVTTQLLNHQKQGLYFLTNKEKERIFSDKEEDNNSLWRLKYRRNGQQFYYNIITGKEERTKPPEVLGGILADMMGLGKTLSILSLIVGSLENAEKWGTQLPPNMDGEKVLIRNSKTTLLVSPLSTVANWEEQIARHIKPGTLKYYIYHGGNRISNLDELGQYDLVITTYSIVSSEYLGRGNKRRDMNPLLQTNFFRIVLDEAHMIREQTTRQSQAICSLSAQRRWAVTGTPVQNRLDDLGALIKFLRIKPFDEKGGFAQHILSPFKNSDPEILPKLRLLVDSITLRRLKDRIDLPARRDHTLKLPFSEDERVLYEWFAQDSQNKLKIIASDQKRSLGGRTYAHILRAIMRLRLICAHGRELLSEDDLKITEGFSSDNAINLDEEEEYSRPAIAPKQAYEIFMLLKEADSDNCVQCARRIEPKDTEETANGKDEIIGCMLPCFQIVCRDCSASFKEQQLSSDHSFKCPFCESTVRASFFDLTREGIEAAEEARAFARENPRQAKIMGRYGGPHTKVKVLLEMLRQSQVESENLPSGERPIKSVVFSGWTAYLDLIQIALEDNDIKYTRLDGKMSRKSRNEALQTFRDDSDVCVILISITAGGLGLDLTAASKAYVMEPQFNPAAEAQAVDRVHRLGQEREVDTIRFVMEKSFEENMLELKRKKQSLADLSMNRGTLDKAEASKRKLDELRSLFK